MQNPNEDKLPQGSQDDFLLHHLIKYLNGQYRKTADGEIRLKKLYEERLSDYEMGFIYKEEYILPEIGELSLWLDEFHCLQNIEEKENYVVISIACMWGIFDAEVIEESLAEFWTKLRKTILKHHYMPELEYLKDNYLGIKLYAFAGVAGYNCCGRSAIVHTSEELGTSNF